MVIEDYLFLRLLEMFGKEWKDLERKLKNSLLLMLKKYCQLRYQDDWPAENYDWGFGGQFPAKQDSRLKSWGAKFDFREGFEEDGEYLALAWLPPSCTTISTLRLDENEYDEYFYRALLFEDGSHDCFLRFGEDEVIVLDELPERVLMDLLSNFFIDAVKADYPYVGGCFWEKLIEDHFHVDE